MGYVKENEIRILVLFNLLMEISWKRKKEGEKEGNVRKGNISELSVRNFIYVFVLLIFLG